MTTKNILLLISLILFSLTCDKTIEPEDCLGTSGGLASMDDCGVCDDDDNNNNATCFDCAGEVNGTHIWDECNVCDTYSTYNINGTWDEGESFVDTNSNGIWDDGEDYNEIGEKPNYPYGDCDCAGVLDGDAMIDYCGDCEGACESGNADSCERLDDCNVCDGNNSPNTGVCDCEGVPGGVAEEDCAGECSGSAELDECGECEGDNSTCDVGCGPNQPGPSGCDNACDSILVEDNCGECGGDNSTCSDCAGEFGGAAYLNECGTCICNGSESLDGYECVESDECLQDCNNDWGGDAIEDNCGICDSDPTNDNQECIQDCNDYWNGTAIIDCSGECSGGNTGILTYTICGCFDTTADNFYCHQDAGECYNTPGVDTCCGYAAIIGCDSDCVLSDDVTASVYSNPFIDSEECFYQDYTQVDAYGNPPLITLGCNGINNVNIDDILIENSNYGLVYNDTSLCEYYGCTDENATNYDETANVDVGNCTYAEASLFFGEITNSTIEIFMQNTQAVGGFQFDLKGGSILSGSPSGGSAEENGLMVSIGGITVIGFSFGGFTIPEGIGLLTIVDASLVSEPICIENVIVSDVSGGNLEVNSTSVCSE